MSEQPRERRKVPTDYRALERENRSFLRKFTSPPFLYPSLYTQELITYPRTDLDGIPRRHCFRIIWKASLGSLCRPFLQTI